MTIKLNDSNRFEFKSDDLKVGAVYVVGFGCFDEQSQARGGDNVYSDHVVNLRKIDALYEVFRQRVDDFFGVENGVELYTDYILGDGFGFREHYVNFKLEIRQSIRSMWDTNMLLKLDEFVGEISKGQEFVYLKAEVFDRTETILNSLENAKTEQ